MTKRSIALAALAVASTAAGLLTVGPPATAAAPTKYTVSATVYRDVNSNGRFDAGEALRGGKVVLNGPDRAYPAVTGPRGKIVLRVPKGKYWVSGSGSGWYLVGRVVTVRGFTGLKLRAVRPLGHVLRTKILFGKDTYRVGDTAGVTITMTNTGATKLLGIAPACDHAGNPNELVNVGANWGALANDRGVTVPAHTTRVFRIGAKVPAGAAQFGEVMLACDFGYPGVDPGYRPQSYDTATVPGQSGAFAGNVYYRSGGTMHALAKVRAVLVDPTRCPLVKRSATTDSTGRFRIGNVPAGQHYRLYLYAPAGWKFTGSNPGNAFVFGKDTVHFSFEAKRGTRHVPNPPTTCS